MPHSPKRRSTAYHEAGHAVVALALGIPFSYVTVIRRGDSLGHISLGDLERHQATVGWSDQEIRARASIVFAAGAEAERIAGIPSGGWSGDKASVTRLAIHPERLWAFSGVAAAELLLLRWEMVEAVAEQLLARRVLTENHVATVALGAVQPRRTGRQRELPLHDAMQAA